MSRTNFPSGDFVTRTTPKKFRSMCSVSPSWPRSNAPATKSAASESAYRAGRRTSANAATAGSPNISPPRSSRAVQRVRVVRLGRHRHELRHRQHQPDRDAEQHQHEQHVRDAQRRAVRRLLGSRPDHRRQDERQRVLDHPELVEHDRRDERVEHPAEDAAERHPEVERGEVFGRRPVLRQFAVADEADAEERAQVQRRRRARTARPRSSGATARRTESAPA